MQHPPPEEVGEKYSSLGQKQLWQYHMNFTSKQMQHFIDKNYIKNLSVNNACFSEGDNGCGHL
jgi:hypothetical protein